MPRRRESPVHIILPVARGSSRQTRHHCLLQGITVVLHQPIAASFYDGSPISNRSVSNGHPQRSQFCWKIRFDNQVGKHRHQRLAVCVEINSSLIRPDARPSPRACSNATASCTT